MGESTIVLSFAIGGKMNKTTLLSKIEKIAGGDRLKFCELIGVSYSALNRWLQGDRQPSKSVILLIKEIEKKIALQKVLNELTKE